MAGNHDFALQFAGGRIFSARLSNERRLKLRLIFDVASVELFADDGAHAMTEVFFPSEDLDDFRLFSAGGMT
jgi:fructan beta-fructosidase